MLVRALVFMSCLLPVRAVVAGSLVPEEHRLWSPETAISVDVRDLRGLSSNESLLLVDSIHAGGGRRPILAVFTASLDERWSVDLLDARLLQVVDTLELASGDLLVAGFAAQSIVVQARARGDGSLLWQHAFQATGPIDVAQPWPALAQDPGSGRIFVAVSDAGTLQLQVVADDGAMQAAIDVPTAGLVHAPNRLVALPSGGLALTTIVGIDGPDAYRTAILDRDGGMVGEDVEAGAIGHAFTRALATGDGHGGLRLLGGLETTCGLPESRLWRLAADGSRLWTHVDAEDPCLATAAVGWAAAPGGGVHVGNHRAAAFGLQQVRADGTLAWSRDWPGLPTGGSLVLRSLAGNAAFQVFMAGEQVVPGSGGSMRPVAVIHGPEGDRCAEGAIADTGSVSGVVALGEQWLLVSEAGSAGPGQLELAIHSAPAGCSGARIFASGFEVRSFDKPAHAG